MPETDDSRSEESDVAASEEQDDDSLKLHEAFNRESPSASIQHLRHPTTNIYHSARSGYVFTGHVSRKATPFPFASISKQTTRGLYAKALSDGDAIQKPPSLHKLHPPRIRTQTRIHLVMSARLGGQPSPTVPRYPMRKTRIWETIPIMTSTPPSKEPTRTRGPSTRSGRFISAAGT